MEGIPTIVGVVALFTSVSALSGGVLLFEEIIDKFWNLDGDASQARTFGLGAILGAVGAYFELGMFADAATCGGFGWYICGPLVGIGAALVANKMFELWGGFKFILGKFGLRPKESDTPSAQ